MRIDTHTHVFTLKSILTREAIRVITQRLIDLGAPDFLTDAIESWLDDQLAKPEFMDERRLLKQLIRKMTGLDSFDAIVRDHFANDLLRVHLDGNLDDLSADALSDIITRVVEKYEGGGKVGVALNIIQTLRQASKSTITDIADDLLKHMDDDGVIVALMMDIYGTPESPRDRRAYLTQISGTAEAALQRPGRVLPFFGVHPDRPDHFVHLKDAVERQGFVGVKLYPSLDYDVDSHEMRRVYQYCMEADLPVLLHCGHGGFYRTKDAIEQCDPEQWTQVLHDFPGLRVCFAHFGGWEALGKRHCLDENWDPDEDGDPDGNWGKKIYDFMCEYPNVYTDLAKHVSMFDTPHEQTYFDTMRELIDDEDIGRRILFGTDAWLLRLDMPFDRYWELWREACGDAWDDVTVAAPKAFLGFPGPERPALAGNLDRFVRYMRQNRQRVGGPPAPWLVEAVAEPFATSREPAAWDFDKQAVRDTYQFLGRLLSNRQAEGDYVQNRLLQLRDLAYFDPGDPNFQGRCRDLARRFIDFADQGEAYTEGHTFGSAVDLFVDVFQDGDLRLCDVALALDSVIAYEDPIA